MTAERLITRYLSLILLILVASSCDSLKGPRDHDTECRDGYVAVWDHAAGYYCAPGYRP